MFDVFIILAATCCTKVLESQSHRLVWLNYEADILNMTEADIL